MTSRTVSALAAACLLLCTGDLALASERPLPPARPDSFPDLPVPPAVPPAATAVSPTLPEGRKLYLPLIAAEAKARGLPPEVADAVARVESGYNSGAVGGDGERGMMQVMPPTAAMLGFKGTAEQLAEPATNIRLGVSYLADAWKLANGNLCRALMKYRAGHNQERMSALSVEYCRRAKSHLASIGSPLAAGPLPQAEFGAVPGGLGPVFAGGATPRVRRVAGRLVKVGAVRTPRTSRSFWAAHGARIRAIEARLPWKRGGIMVGS
ncbi:MAG: Lytic transglycosylase catalytic [Enterovirga sp.]|nr:Lytic transglycosylase catalytic [Enterovirga sp.]